MKSEINQQSKEKPVAKSSMKNDSNVLDLSGLNTITDFQNLINEHKINSINTLKRLFGEDIASKLKNLIKDTGEKVKYIRDLTKYSLEDVQNYINEHEINNPGEFYEYNTALYKKAKNWGYLTKLKYNKFHSTPVDKINYCTIEEIQKFINDNDIFNKSSLFLLNRGIYEKARRRNFLDKLEFPYKKQRSLIEDTTCKLLDDNKINYIEQYSFPWLKGNSNHYLRLDIFIPNLNLAIECQGKQHFIPVDYFGGEEAFLEIKNRDILKFNLCKEHSITVLYFTEFRYIENSVLYEINNYFAPIITSKEELIQKILTFKKD